jgi:hypothetical protein
MPLERKAAKKRGSSALRLFLNVWFERLEPALGAVYFEPNLEL